MSSATTPKTPLSGLARPFFVLAPMDDVTDTVFRQVIAGCQAPDLYFTEFVNVDGLCSAGHDALMPKLKISSDVERPIIAQIWGKIPEHFETVAKELVVMGYDGIDINMGCPDKAITKNGCCSALIENRDLAAAIIAATKRGSGSLPVSVKTRLGFNEVDFTWHEFLLKQGIDMLTVHGRTKKEMSLVPANWDAIGHIRTLRDNIAPQTLVVGNGDVMNREQGLALAAQHELDGVMIGRGIFHDPYAFATDSPWEHVTKQDKLALYRRHITLFAETWQHHERKLHTLNRFCKIYINGFDGAKELREQLMHATSTDELLRILADNQ